MIPAITAVVLLAGMIVCYFLKVHRPIFPLSILEFLMLGLLLPYAHNPLASPSHYIHHTHSESHYIVQLLEPSHPTPKGQKAVVEVVQVDSVPTSGRMMLFLRNRTVQLSYGDRLLVRGTPSFPSASENPYQFDYRNYLRHKKICFQMFAGEADFDLLESSPKGLLAWSQRLRQHLIGIIQSLPLSASEQGIAEALLLGWKDDLSPETERQFRSAGITHLLCVSGLHVGIVAVLAGWLLFWVRKGPIGRYIKGVLQLGVVWLFAMITGFAPSTTRAALMFSVFIVGDMTLNSCTRYNSLAASALVLLLVNPGVLFDVGFQLSYSAVSGILCLSQPMFLLIPWPKDVYLLSRNRVKSLGLLCARKVWSLFCVTTSAQLATTPLVLYYFHQFPRYFLIANMTIVPFAGVLLGTVIMALFFPHWSMATGLLRKELYATDAVTQWISSIPGALVENIAMDEVMLAGTVLLVVGVIVWVKSKRLIFLPVVLAVGLIFAVYCRAVGVMHDGQRICIRYNAGYHIAIELVEGRHSTLIADEAVARDPSIIDYQCRNFLTRKQVTRTRIISTDTCGSFLFAGQEFEIDDLVNREH